MSKIKVVQIGALHDHASATMLSLLKLSDIYEVAGYVVPEGESVLVPSAYEGVPRITMEEALAMPDLDAAIIESSELNLCKCAIPFAEKGVHIHMDKPGGIILDDFEKLISIIKARGLVFQTGYMYRFNPAVIQLMDDINSGKLGKIYAVEAHMNCLHTPEKRQWLVRFPGGMLFFLGCHLIDLIYRIMGEPIDVIPLSSPIGTDGVTAQDYGMAVLKYPSGPSFAKSCAAEHGGFMRRQLVVCGSLGTVQLCPIEEDHPDGGLISRVRECIDSPGWGDDGRRYALGPVDRYDDMMRAFAEFVQGKSINPYTPDYELGLYRLVLKCCGA